MKKSHSLITATVFAATTAFASTAAATTNIELVFSGVPTANSSSWPNSPAFTQWCNGICFPTTEFPVYDASTGQQKGAAHVWGKSFAFGSGGSLCFSEFIAFALNEGNIYVNSGVNGTCGAPIDPQLKPPKYPELGATVVLAGGGDGFISGGTQKYQGWTGTYTDRVFVGFGDPISGVGGIIYYDQLWFSISGK